MQTGYCHLENYKEMVDQQKIKSHLLTKVKQKLAPKWILV